MLSIRVFHKLSNPKSRCKVQNKLNENFHHSILSYRYFNNTKVGRI